MIIFIPRVDIVITSKYNNQPKNLILGWKRIGNNRDVFYYLPIFFSIIIL